MSDKEILDWIDKDPEDRLVSIRWRIINENCTIRQAVEFLAKENHKLATGQTIPIDNGMDLRDAIAISVLPAIHLGFIALTIFKVITNAPTNKEYNECQFASEMAYEYADEMMRHREKQ